MAKSITRIDVEKPDLLQRKRVAAYARVSMDTERLMHVYVVKDDGEGELTSLSEEEIEQFSAMFYEPDEDIEFSLESWHSMVDYATVYSADDIRFTFKNGQEFQA